MVCVPGGSALIVVSGTSTVRLSVFEFHVPSTGRKMKPDPGAPTVSKKPSAATTFDTGSVAEAVTRTAGVDELTPIVPLVAAGTAATAEVVGPVLSIVRTVDATGPGLSKKSV